MRHAARPDRRGAPTAGPHGAEPPGALTIAVDDFYFAPGAPTIGRGDTVTFDFVGDITHTATDSSGLELFDSGNVPPGSGPSLSFTYEAAGVYNFVCTPHDGMAGRVSVPMRAAPAAGRRHATFMLVWARGGHRRPRLRRADPTPRGDVEHVAQRGRDPP